MAEEGAEGLPLVAALLDLPGAHPDSAALRLILSGICADPRVQAGLFSACRPGHEWALEHAPKMTVSLTVPSPSWPLAKPPDEKVVQAWPAKLAFVSEALSHRDSQTQETCLKLTCDRGTHAECLAAVPEALGGAGAGITELQLLSPGWYSRMESPGLIVALGGAPTAFTNLKSLTLDTCFAILPDPSLLPHLAHLCTKTLLYGDESLHSKYPDACASVGRFVPQLTSLYIDRPIDDTDIPWDTIFTHTSDTLQVFGTNATLTDDLYLLLTTKLSRLRSVGVDDLCLHLDECPATPWPGWDELRIKEPGVYDLAMMLPSPTIPVAVRASTLRLSGEVPDDRLQPWLEQTQWHILPKPVNPDSCHIPKERNIEIGVSNAGSLHVWLATLQAMKYEPTDIPKLTMGFSWRFPMTAEAMQTLELLPHGRLLDFRTCDWPLEPAAYTQLAQHVPTSFTTWQFDQGVSQEFMNSVCAGINARRGALSMPSMRVELYTHTVKETQIGDCVVLGPVPGAVYEPAVLPY